MSFNAMTYKTSTDHTFFGLFRNLNNLEVLDLSSNNLDLTGKKRIFYQFYPLYII